MMLWRLCLLAIYEVYSVSQCPPDSGLACHDYVPCQTIMRQPKTRTKLSKLPLVAGVGLWLPYETLLCFVFTLGLTTQMNKRGFTFQPQPHPSLQRQSDSGLRPEGHRKRGRPKTTWRRTVEAEAAAMGQSWGTLRMLAQNRERWKEFVAALIANGKNGSGLKEYPSGSKETEEDQEEDKQECVEMIIIVTEKGVLRSRAARDREIWRCDSEGYILQWMDKVLTINK
ncbi:hypothetical protein EGW08_015211 [Elysia chlorotica]|uniref:Uncharacterized protein n=1 Tax=Elysia chlorotica TaxID=188477 RepID=A0A3S1BBW9_ELYCH|nr:hypothetical protein EGW08_015211 [Elysia chlorotica]